MAWFRFWSTVLVPEVIYKVETPGGGITLAATARHAEQILHRQRSMDEGIAVDLLAAILV